MNDTPASRKAAIWVVVVFLLGAAAGGMLGYGYAHAHQSVSAASAPPLEPERRARRVEQLTHELALTNAQAKQLDAILLKWHGQVKAIHDQSDAQTEQLRQKGRDEVRGILTQEQKPKFEEFLQKLDAERKHSAPR